MEVEVLTGFPNYPGGKIFPGYRQRAYKREVMGGIVVHRVPLYPSHNRRAGQRISSYASFAASSAIGMHHLRHCDAILVFSTPVSVGFGPAVRKTFRRQPVVTMIQDLWPETLLHSGFAKNGFFWQSAQKLALTLSNAIYNRSDAIAVIAPGMIDALVDRGVNRRKIKLIHNWVPDEALTAMGSSSDSINIRKSKESLVVIYAGNLGQPQAARSIVDAASTLRGRDDIEFVIVGSGVLERELRKHVKMEGLDQVRFLGPKRMDEIPGLVAQADIQLVTLAPRRIFEMTIPSKLQFSLGFGKAIVAAVSGDPANVAQESGAAIVCSPGSSEELANSISQAAALPRTQLEIMGRSGKEYFNKHFTEKVGGDALADLLLTVIADSPRKMQRKKS